MQILDYLNSKPAHYAKIDYQRMPRIYAKYKDFFELKPIIHIVGTNGKGSTGRWLALMLKQAGFVVGHYTSPHVLEYNERFWLDGKNISYKKLNILHDRLSLIFEKEDFDSISYFEYSTFLAILAFKKCDFIILEAGLGGEYDATNVFKKRLSIITSIGFDHGDFLGFTLKSIATTKIKSITTTSVISNQNNEEVIQIAKNISHQKGIELKIPSLNENKTSIQDYIKKYDYPDFFFSNLQTAYLSANLLGVEPNLDTLQPLDLIGRSQKISKNITIDVGHNPLAASNLVKNFKPKSITLIYNSFKDKDIELILTILKPIIKKVEILPLKSKDRILGEEEIKRVLDKLNIKWSSFDFFINDHEEYLVFGSFYAVEEFLRKFNAQ